MRMIMFVMYYINIGVPVSKYTHYIYSICVCVRVPISICMQRERGGGTLSRFWVWTVLCETPTSE